PSVSLRTDPGIPPVVSVPARGLTCAVTIYASEDKTRTSRLTNGSSMGQFAGYGNFDQRSGDAAAFRNLVGEALALCLAADPKLGADMAQLLKIERPAAIQARDGLPPIAALSTCFRMLIYAH